MNRNESYSSGRRRGRRRNERQGRSRDGRGGGQRSRGEPHERSGGRERERDARKSARREVQRGIQREIQRILQKVSAENESAIREFRENVRICEICGRPILAEEIDSALSNRETGNPAHFDCVLAQVAEREHPQANERLTYIGQGRFALLHFANPHDLRKFTIRRTIEWESRDDRLGWRTEIAGLFSRIR